MSRIRANTITNLTIDGPPTVSTGLQVTGVTTSTQFKVGTAVTINSDGADIVGIVTATSFAGSGANLTNLPASGDSNDITACLFI